MLDTSFNKKPSKETKMDTRDKILLARGAETGPPTHS
jgi:hypothetical protein